MSATLELQPGEAEGKEGVTQGEEEDAVCS